MSFTLAQLKTAIQDYTEYDETTFVNNLPIFIRQAEERILKNVQLSLFRKNALGSLSSGNRFLACPTDFWLLFLYLLLIAQASTTFYSSKILTLFRQ